MATSPLRVVPAYTPYTQGDIIDLLGGLNDARSDEFIAPNELSSVSNYGPDPESSGVVTKREGVSRVSTQQTDPFTSVHNGVNDIFATTSTSIINDAGADQSVTLTNVDDPDWATFYPTSYDIVANGTEVKFFDGTSWADLGGIPRVKYLSVYNSFLFGAGHDGGKVRWSATGNPNSWPAENLWEVAGTARGLIQHRNVNYFFTNLGWHQLSGFDEEAITIPFSGEPGTTHHSSLVSTPFGLFWWSEEGIMRKQDGELQVDNISRLKIPKTFESLNFDKFSLVHGVYNKSRQRVEFYAFKSSSTTHDLRIDYYPRIGVSTVEGISLGSFWINEGAGAQQAASAEVLVSGAPKVYLGPAASNLYLYDETGDTDDGTVVSAHLETYRLATEYGPESIKRIKMLVPSFILNGNATVTFGVYKNDETSLTSSWDLALQSSSGFLLDTDALDTGVLGVGGSTPVQSRVAFKRKYRKLKFRLEDSAPIRTKLTRILNRGYIIAL